jgi:hypothetical protein
MDGCDDTEATSVVCGTKDDVLEVSFSKPEDACRASIFSLLTGEPT